MISLLRALLLCGTYAGLLVTIVTGTLVNACGDHESDHTHEAELHCDDMSCEEADECHTTDCHEDESPCDSDDHSDEHHHHHHHSCTSDSIPVAALTQGCQQLSHPSHKLSLIVTEHLDVPDAPVLSEDKPPLI
jgi:hypothetical protein